MTSNYLDFESDDLYITHYFDKKSHIVKITHTPTNVSSSSKDPSFLKARMDAEILLKEKVRDWVDKNGPFLRTKKVR